MKAFFSITGLATGMMVAVLPVLMGGATPAAAASKQASGPLNCSQFGGQPFQDCSFTVTRAGGGTATVVVTFMDGSKRTIDFKEGKATKADGAGAVRQERWHDLNTVYVGDNERFEIPDAVLFGG